MRNKRSVGLLVLLMLLLCGVILAQVKQESRTLVVNGKSGEAAVVQINSRTYVDLENLARIANGSLGFHKNQITLTLPGGYEASAPAPAPAPEQPVAHVGLSRNFMMAGIETLAEMREWASTMAYAIQNGYGVTESWAADYREKAANALRQASASVDTDADRNALQLLTNEFDAVREWSNKLVEAKKSMDTAKYSTSPNALRDEPLSQKIISCGHFLGTMLGSAEFKDDPSCH
jgi:hypothetical protein